MSKIVAMTLAAAGICLAGGAVVVGSAAQQMPRDRTAAAQRASDEAAFERRAAELERAAVQQASDAPAHHAVGAMYFEKAREQALGPEQKRQYIARGIAAEERALAINPDYVEALVYKNLLLRLQAVGERDPVVREALIRDADALRGRALALQRSRQEAHAVPEGTVVTPGPPPPPPPPPPGGVSEPIQWVYAETTFTAAGAAPVKTKDVRPIYAPMAIAIGHKGDVVLEATVDGRGRVAGVRVVRTQPMLTQAAIDAVRQWEFDPKTVAPGGTVITVTARFTPPGR